MYFYTLDGIYSNKYLTIEQSFSFKYHLVKLKNCQSERSRRPFLLGLKKYVLQLRSGMTIFFVLSLARRHYLLSNGIYLWPASVESAGHIFHILFPELSN